MHRLKSGFTLIELMIVIAIIAILAAMSLPSYQDRLVRQQVQESIAFAEFARDSVQMFYARRHRMPADNVEAALPEPARVFGNYITRLEVDHGAISLQFGNRTNKAIAGKWLTLRPGTVADAPQVPVSWLCGGAKPVEGLTYAGTNRTELSPENMPIDCRL